MIKNILYIEEGSVDVDELREQLSEETLIIPYRQGGRTPVLVQPNEPITDCMDYKFDALQAKYKALREKTEELLKEISREKKLTKRTHKKIGTFGVEYLGW